MNLLLFRSNSAIIKAIKRPGGCNIVPIQFKMCAFATSARKTLKWTPSLDIILRKAVEKTIASSRAELWEKVSVQMAATVGRKLSTSRYMSRWTTITRSAENINVNINNQFSPTWTEAEETFIYNSTKECIESACRIKLKSLAVALSKPQYECQRKINQLFFAGPNCNLPFSYSENEYLLLNVQHHRSQQKAYCMWAKLGMHLGRTPRQIRNHHKLLISSPEYSKLRIATKEIFENSQSIPITSLSTANNSTKDIRNARRAYLPEEDQKIIRSVLMHEKYPTMHDKGLWITLSEELKRPAVAILIHYRYRLSRTPKFAAMVEQIRKELEDSIIEPNNLIESVKEENEGNIDINNPIVPGSDTPKKSRVYWTKNMIALREEGIKKYQGSLLPLWPQVANHINQWLKNHHPQASLVTPQICCAREIARRKQGEVLLEKPWTPDEVNKLVELVQKQKLNASDKYKTIDWVAIGAELNRSNSSCLRQYRSCRRKHERAALASNLKT